jgi:hypothetical protein
LAQPESPCATEFEPQNSDARRDLDTVLGGPKIVWMRGTRTTLLLDSQLLKRAKTLAAQRGTTVSAIVNQALSQVLAGPTVEAAPDFEMVVFGSASNRHQHSPSDFAAEAEEQDRRSLGRRSS